MATKGKFVYVYKHPAVTADNVIFGEETGLKLGVKDLREVSTFSEINLDPREREISQTK